MLKHSSTSHIRKLLQENALYVFALKQEAGNVFRNVPKIYTGVGKINAAIRLTEALITVKPSIIINLGSAGSPTYARQAIVCCTKFIQRDMDVTPLGFKKYATPFSKQGPILEYGLKVNNLPEGICGTGDNFETAHRTNDYNVLDMEAYALALVAKKNKIPFLCLKYISDGADGKAKDDWPVMVKYAAKALKTTLDRM